MAVLGIVAICALGAVCVLSGAVLARKVRLWSREVTRQLDGLQTQCNTLDEYDSQAREVRRDMRARVRAVENRLNQADKRRKQLSNFTGAVDHSLIAKVPFNLKGRLEDVERAVKAHLKD